MPSGLWAGIDRRSHVLDGGPAVLRDVVMATNFGTQFAITGFLWPPCVADADIIFLPCGFFLSSIFFYSSPNLTGRRLDVYHTPHMVWP